MSMPLLLSLEQGGICACCMSKWYDPSSFYDHANEDKGDEARTDTPLSSLVPCHEAWLLQKPPINRR